MGASGRTLSPVGSPLTPHVPTSDLTHKILKERPLRAGEGVLAVSRVGLADLALTPIKVWRPDDIVATAM